MSGVGVGGSYSIGDRCCTSMAQSSEKDSRLPHAAGPAEAAS